MWDMLQPCYSHVRSRASVSLKAEAMLQAGSAHGSALSVPGAAMLQPGHKQGQLLLEGGGQGQ